MLVSIHLHFWEYFHIGLEYRRFGNQETANTLIIVCWQWWINVYGEHHIHHWSEPERAPHKQYKCVQNMWYMCGTSVTDHAFYFSANVAKFCWTIVLQCIRENLCYNRFALPYCFQPSCYKLLYFQNMEDERALRGRAHCHSETAEQRKEKWTKWWAKDRAWCAAQTAGRRVDAFCVMKKISSHWFHLLIVCYNKTSIIISPLACNKCTRMMQ